LSNAEIAAGPAGVEGSDIKVWTQGQDTGNFSSITGNKAFTVPPGTQVRIIGATLDGHSRPGRRQTITEPNKPLNVGLSSRLPDELFKEKPFQERNVRNPVCRLISIMALLAE
jgi:hypothetical protein